MTDLKKLAAKLDTIEWRTKEHHETVERGTGGECRTDLLYSIKDVEFVIDYARELEKRINIGRVGHVDHCVEFNAGWGSPGICLCSMPPEVAKRVRHVKFDKPVGEPATVSLGTLMHESGRLIPIEDQKIEWGTNWWGSIMTEPSEHHAVQVAASGRARLYNRITTDGEWFEVKS